MKTAEELFVFWCGGSYIWGSRSMSDTEMYRWENFATWYNKQQLDVYKQGMTDAADIVRGEFALIPRSIKLATSNAILTARDAKVKT